MIKRSEIVKRIYDGRVLVEFSVKVKYSNDSELEFEYKRSGDSPRWYVSVVIDGSVGFGDVVCRAVFDQPSMAMTIEQVAAMGMMQVNVAMMEHVQKMSSMSFSISEKTKDM